MTNRYRATITVRVDFDADSRDEAVRVAEGLEGSLAVDTPRGRDAVLDSIVARVGPARVGQQDAA